jgi:S-methylmethionine-dependent homocysteine/selenocysteine methylase
MRDLLERNELILLEAAIVEPIRRSGRVELHPELVNAPLIYDTAGADALRDLYETYIEIAEQAGLPLLLCTPTWRANRERVDSSGAPRTINRDAVAFLRGIPQGGEIRIGGLIGCKNDSYRPELGLPVEEAEAFHAWQLGELAEAGVDFLVAETICTVTEAVGIARAMSKTDLPSIISFVIRRDGRIFDGTNLLEGMLEVDRKSEEWLAGFMVNCAWPAFLRAENQPPELFQRLIGFQANGSSRDHTELDGAAELLADDIAVWGELMLDLNRKYGVKILGGCCGTGPAHLRYLVENRASRK